MRESRVLGIGGAFVIAVSAFAAPPALANGGDFFAELAATFQQANSDLGPSYFGFIRDERGRVVPGASVAATITTSGSSMIVKSDILGHYKIPGFAKHIDPNTVEIGCSKPGYRQVSAMRRGQQRQANAPVETTCVLTAATANAAF